MGVTYHFGYPNMQRIVAIDEAVNNAQNGEKYQVNYLSWEVSSADGYRSPYRNVGLSN